MTVKTPKTRAVLVAATIDLVQALRCWLEAAAAPHYARLRPWWSAVQTATGADGGRAACFELYAQALGVALALILQKPASLLRPDVQRWLIATANPLWQDLLVDLYAWLDGCSGTGRGRPDQAASAALDRLRRRCEGEAAVAIAQRRQTAPADGLAPGFLEHFLSAHDAAHRRRRGVFYTPRPLARFILTRVDQQLCQEFGLADGLADTVTWSAFAVGHPDVVIPAGMPPQTPLIRLLDPALGSGVFLEEAVALIHRRLDRRWRDGGRTAAQRSASWNAYVTADLLPRLLGLEIMLPACLAAYLNLADTLSGTGFGFEGPAKVEIHLADTLRGPRPAPDAELAGREDPYTAAVASACELACDHPLTVIVGNPPFSGISQTAAAWIGGLLRGQEPRTPGAADYYRVAGQALGERKSWLQDDYVKFLRYAHWQIERAGLGLVGLISNHGYLDNPTFRGLRFQLLQTFPRIDVVDLHGNQKKKEAAPGGGADENVFGVASGAAIGFFRRPPRSVASMAGAATGTETGRAGQGSPASETAPPLAHQDLWGSAADKLHWLEAACSRDSASSPLDADRRWTPQPPNFLFVPRNAALDQEYGRGYRLTEVMPMNVTAPVTARDGFVVALEREELLQRIETFSDLSIPDEVIRQKFFTNTRSARYLPGDTRGWKLHLARRRLAADARRADHIRTCWYRPFDRRWIYWSAEMIDWPRQDVVGHLLAGPNLSLIARRQMLPSQPCTYFWVADDLAVDGVIRSDNRGSESLFPLYRYEPAEGGAGRCTANLDRGFVDELQRRLGLVWTDDPAPASRQRRPGGISEQGCGGAGRARQRAQAAPGFGAEQVLCYCYALFHSETYRQRYADPLRSDFPRVFVPSAAELFLQLADHGRRLVDDHLLRSSAAAVTAPPQDEQWQVAPGYPRYQPGRVLVNSAAGFEGVPPEVWQFHAGGHQVCRKWLKDRRGRLLSERERGIYPRIVAAVAQTLDRSRQIDLAIEHYGGWPAAFA